MATTIITTDKMTAVRAATISQITGNDTIAVDGTLSTLSIDAGAGNDNIMVGQLFKSERQNTAEANVADLDVFSTTPTSQGLRKVSRRCRENVRVH